MKITLLGTSHGDPTATRFQSSSLIETQGHYYLVDVGEGASSLLIRKGLKPSMISAVFLTHMHADHAAGIPVFLEQACKYRREFPEIKPVILCPDPNAEQAALNWLEVMGGCNKSLFEIKSYQAGKFYDDGIIRLEAFPTKHMAWATKNPALKSYSFKISAENKRVLFTGDLTGDFSDFPFDATNGCDMLISELVHFPAENAYARLKDIQLGRLVFNHLGNQWQTPEGSQKLLDLFKDVKYSVAVGYDGMEIELGK